MVLLDHIQALGVKKPLQKIFSSWLKIKSLTSEILVYLIDFFSRGLFYVQINFGAIPDPGIHEAHLVLQFYVKILLLSPCHFISSFLLKIPSQSD